MGDVVHCLVAVAEAKAKFPELQIDWIVEKSFADIVRLSGLVETIFAIEFRKWRKKPFKFYQNPEVKGFLKALRKVKYDLILDAQGLLKSAFLARHAKGKRLGFDKNSAREPFASYFYQTRIAVDKQQHAITRQRQLFAQALDYQLNNTQPSLFLNPVKVQQPTDKRLIFLHGTAWESKKLPLRIWRELLQFADADGYQVELFYGNQQEFEFASQMAKNNPHVLIHEKLSLSEIIEQMQTVCGVISVDTGLAHIANAMNLPMVMLFGPTHPELTGATHVWAKNMQSSDNMTANMQRDYNKRDENSENPYMSAFSADAIYQQLKKVICDKAL